MVYPQEHILLRFVGHFGTSTTIADKWSVGMRFGLGASAPAYDPAKLQTFVNAAQTAGIAFHTTTGAATGLNTFFDHVTGAQIGVSGRYTPSTQLTVISPDTPTNGLTTPVQPWNSALVMSLRTAIPRGRGSNGRVYWPYLGQSPVATTGRLSQANVDARLAAFQTFANALNTAANTYSAGCRLIVASNVGGGIHAVVTSVRCDDRFDSIERRENDQAAVYRSVTLA